jgi:hypothetical protein
MEVRERERRSLGGSDLAEAGFDVIDYDTDVLGKSV